LTHRPVVVRDSVEIEIQVKTGEEEAYLSLDGQVGLPVRDGDLSLIHISSASCSSAWWWS